MLQMVKHKLDYVRQTQSMHLVSLIFPEPKGQEIDATTYERATSYLPGKNTQFPREKGAMLCP